MFEFLKDMLGIPRKVEIVGYEDPEVILKSERPLDLGVVDIQATIAGVEIRGQVQIVESAEEECRGFWVAPKEALPFLVEVFSPNESRESPRLRRKLRVRSPQLDGYQGQSVDLSLCGMRLLGQGRFKLGDRIDLSFELDDKYGTEVSARSRICWMAPTRKDGWVAMGLKYEDLNESEQQGSFEAYKVFLEGIGHAERAL